MNLEYTAAITSTRNSLAVPRSSEGSALAGAAAHTALHLDPVQPTCSAITVADKSWSSSSGTRIRASNGVNDFGAARCSYLGG